MRVVAQAHASLRAAARRMLMHAAPWDGRWDGRGMGVGRGVITTYGMAVSKSYYTHNEVRFLLVMIDLWAGWGALP